MPRRSEDQLDPDERILTHFRSVQAQVIHELLKHLAISVLLRDVIPVPIQRALRLRPDTDLKEYPGDFTNETYCRRNDTVQELVGYWLVISSQTIGSSAWMKARTDTTRA